VIQRSSVVMHVLRHALTEADERVVQALVDEHVEVSCYLVPIDETTWAIQGSIAVDGEVIVAEFRNRADAETALEELAAAGLGARTGSASA
jgi:hypothetical protein